MGFSFCKLDNWISTIVEGKTAFWTEEKSWKIIVNSWKHRTKNEKLFTKLRWKAKKSFFKSKICTKTHKVWPKTCLPFRLSNSKVDMLFEEFCYVCVTNRDLIGWKLIAKTCTFFCLKSSPKNRPLIPQIKLSSLSESHVSK